MKRTEVACTPMQSATSHGALQLPCVKMMAGDIPRGDVRLPNQTLKKDLQVVCAINFPYSTVLSNLVGPQGHPGAGNKKCSKLCPMSQCGDGKSSTFM